ncbi:MAG TPA: 4Fe-4S binding protein [Sulfurovum sp.]|jgi:pyruvate ferredoxin oxidoreductase delta subunit|nr:MAG: pyruvate ferredoxin oxidoreductase [Sulfurovum sp. 35-42-20]OYY56823.1 MAG: pyruvate ferredoxin oxidoreductase [Sulfurovum sp. 28-43-6]OYZ25632.1 MAG: pyruvate ferredoxin oxidoreductase [Sulfurovum sp. 16-42-52]OYZ49741.1 MAG: pyruvate ferredoxin oxidoreductase [Sulfurovum sp. 24-42-9]OZA45750.1 MAG: pyruvate ferredoxin oxidoreductase [Sulfurovum sp. 17-42-90]OZA59726.1 MAG: pyruvate ferredoxin oxidoreductase [Sulfurovum sp. 39-42-12]HQR73867.1 4Fe-4S binding protein [Sulfurovum sp.]
MLQNGWDTFEIGTILRPFEGSISDASAILPEDRLYSQSNSFSVSVADWRIEKPLFNKDLCIDCQFCWIYCPDMSIISRDKKMVAVDYDHCKGCGICVQVCPTTPKALLMFPEQKDEEEALLEWPKKEKKEKEN